MITLGACLVVVILQLMIITVNLNKPTVDVKPWQNMRPDAALKVLFAGDSTAVGQGLEDNRLSTSGLFSRDYPQVHLENYSENGLHLKGLGDFLEHLQDKKFDLAVLQIGGNDIMFFTPLEDIRRELERVLTQTKHIAKKIIILHSGDIGQSKLFLWPLTWVYTRRSNEMRDIYLAHQDDRVTYIDIMTLNKSEDISNLYAIDNIHPNAAGYALWYRYIKQHLLQSHWI